MTAVLRLQALFVLLALVLAAGCEVEDLASGGMGGSGGGSGGSGGDGQYAEGGMGGSGSGTTSDYGSLWVGEHRYFRIHENARVTLDGDEVEPDSIGEDLQGIPLGINVEYTLAAGDEEHPASADSGLINVLRAHHRAIGPVTREEPLEVLGQPVLINGRTFVEGLPDEDPEALEKGDVVQVAGHANAYGSIRATRVAKPDALPSEWRVRGRISDLEDDDAGFHIGEQRFQVNGAPINDCEEGLEAGTPVLVRAAPETGYESGDSLVPLEIRCLPEGLSLFREYQQESGEQLPGEMPAAVDGVITGLELDELLMLNLDGQRVKVDPASLLELLGGTLEQLRIGGRLEVHGTLDTETGVVTAEWIELQDPPIDLSAPLSEGLIGTVVENVAGLSASVVPGLEDPLELVSGDVITETEAHLTGFLGTDYGGERRFFVEKVEEVELDGATTLLAPVTAILQENEKLELGSVLSDPANFTSDDDSILFSFLEDVVCLLLCFDNDEEEEPVELHEGDYVRLSDFLYDKDKGMITEGHFELESSGEE